MIRKANIKIADDEGDEIAIDVVENTADESLNFYINFKDHSEDIKSLVAKCAAIFVQGAADRSDEVQYGNKDFNPKTDN